MNHFEYRSGELHAEGVPVSAIAEAVGTPVYVYSSATLERHYRVFAAAFEGLPTTICYAVKANSNLAVIRTLAALGAGADVVSEGELRRALAAGVAPGSIVFSGVGKTAAEIAFALDQGILQFNVESEPELEALSALACSKDTVAPIMIRINPDVDARTHAKISTGKSENKFGVPWERAREVYARAAALPGIEVVGVDVHIGSQLTRLAPFEQAFRRVAELVAMLREDGHRIHRLDLGGGLGIPYDDETPPHPEDYGAMVRRVVGRLGCELVLEPGRVLVGNAGILVCRVIYLKEGAARTFAVLDGAMNDFIRPAMYQAFHRILPVRQAPLDGPSQLVDLVGPVCESTDTFATNRELPLLAAGDRIVFCSAGAYGAVMASTYNTRPLVPEVMPPEPQPLCSRIGLAMTRDSARIRRCLNNCIVSSSIQAARDTGSGISRKRLIAGS